MQPPTCLFILVRVSPWAPMGTCCWEHPLLGKHEVRLPSASVIDLLLLNNDSTIPNDPYPAQLC